MSENEIDLLAIDCGTVTAPAGCGKTHLIADSLMRHGGEKPILVLTHTNAGVVALRQRLNRLDVSSKAYRLSTIDGWAIQIISTFPMRSMHNPDILNLANPSRDYPKIRSAAANLLESGNINDIIKASYDRLIVDEYQDCSVWQNSMVIGAAQMLPTCVLGDPMQAIFDFGSDRSVEWENVCAYFPLAHELATPWRWINVDRKPLGRWLLDVRNKLQCGDSIDLREAPDGVTWVKTGGSEDDHLRLKAASAPPPDSQGHVLIIGDSKNPDSQRYFASQILDAVTVEAVDLRDLVKFSEEFDLSKPDALEILVSFAQNIMRNVSATDDLILRAQAFEHQSGGKSSTSIEATILSFIRSPSYRAAVDVLVEISREAGVSTHRPTVLHACFKALKLCDETEDISFYDAVIRVREQNRLDGRPLPKRAVGSTLLLKGLEADMSVILNADELDACNLYVAMTRGSKNLTVCASSPILNPLI